MSDDELRTRSLKTAVYARVTAGHKLRIIRAWKANDAVVAMTGDGVNDAPAIKGAVYFHSLRTETVEVARTQAFAVLVFAELLRSFGARSETKPVWRISLFTNLNLLLVVCASYGFQIWSHHNGILGRFLKTSPIPLTEGLLLGAMGTHPLLVLELVKVVRNARRESGSMG